MQFVYKPEGIDPKKWDFAPEKLMNPESEAIERVTKMTFGEWADAVTRGSVTAIHALLWVLLKRADPTLTYDAVQFSLSEVDFELTDEESAEMKTVLEAKVANGEELSPGDAALLAKLRETVPVVEAGADEPEESEDPKVRPALVS
jgi:hypothetical protein